MKNISDYEIFEKRYKEAEAAYLKAFGMLEADLLSYTAANTENNTVGKSNERKADEKAEGQSVEALNAGERNYMDMSVFELSDKIGAGIRTMSRNLTGKTAVKEPAIGELKAGMPLNEPSKQGEQNEAYMQNNASSDAVAMQSAAGMESSANASASEESKAEKTADELLAEMDALVGLDTVKKDIRSMINFIRVCKLREERGMKAPKLSYHMVFSGNPGTGKTTIARKLAELYKAIGLLPKGQLVEVDRSGLIAGYQGQTAIKTAEVIQSAIGGVLFIDEAYALVDSDTDTYGKECIATILKAMEDHRDELIVIVSGYSELMHKFIESNPGLKSRFNKYIHFPDYTGEEMENIFLLQCKNNGYEIETEAQELLRAVFDDWYETRDENFGNGRTVRNSFEKIINCQASRLASDSDITDEELRTLTLQDVKDGLELSPDKED